jgi:hypothetical protein
MQEPNNGDGHPQTNFGGNRGNPHKLPTFCLLGFLAADG